MRVATVVVTSPLTKDSSQIRFIQWNKKVSRERIEQIRDEVKARNHSSQDNDTAPVTIRMKLRCGHEENYRQDSILTRRFVGSAAQQYAEHAGVIVVEDVPSLLKANATRSSELWFATITSAVAPMRQCAYRCCFDEHAAERGSSEPAFTNGPEKILVLSDALNAVYRGDTIDRNLAGEFAIGREHPDLRGSLCKAMARLNLIRIA
jgi:hypothetical protein